MKRGKEFYESGNLSAVVDECSQGSSVYVRLSKGAMTLVLYLDEVKYLRELVTAVENNELTGPNRRERLREGDGTRLSDPVVLDDKDASIRVRLTIPERELLLAIGQAMLVLLPSTKIVATTSEPLHSWLCNAMQRVQEEPE